MHTLKVTDIDATCSRLEQLEEEAKAIRAELLERVQRDGFIPPKAEKSRRLCGELYQVTVSTSARFDLKEPEILAIREVCRPDLFERLFRCDTIVRWRVADTANMLLGDVLPEGAPRNLRAMFLRAQTMKENSPRLKIERIGAEDVEK